MNRRSATSHTLATWRPKYTGSASPVYMRTTATDTLATDGITLVTSRWVITNRASGYTRSSASMLRQCAGLLSRHRDGGRRDCSSSTIRRW